MKRGNTISIKGNVTRDVQIRRTNSGINACSWGIAWNDSKKNQSGEWVDVPNFFDVECWASDGQLKFLEGIRKGDKCAIIGGHIEQQTWEKDGNKKSKVVIRVDDPVSGMVIDSKAKQAPIEVQAELYDDSIPF